MTFTYSRYLYPKFVYSYNINMANLAPLLPEANNTVTRQGAVCTVQYFTKYIVQGVI